MSAPAAGMAADYRKLIDAETWAFIDRSLAIYPPESATWPWIFRGSVSN